MCVPLAVAAIAAELLGTGLNYMGQKKAENATLSAFNNERDRQNAFKAQQQQAFQDSLNSTQNTLLDPTAIAKATANRDAALMGAVKPAAISSGGPLLPGSASANPVVKADAEAKGKLADSRTSNLAAAMAALGGMNDLFQTNNIQLGRDAGSIGQIGSFMNGSLGVLQSEMDAAKHKGGTLRGLGGLAQTIGSAMMAASGLPSGGGAMTVTPDMLNPQALSFLPGPGIGEFSQTLPQLGAV
jgi:hypothetical protein